MPQYKKMLLSTEKWHSLVVVLLLLVAVRESVHVLVVKKAVVSISPGEFLRSDAEIFVGDELRPCVSILVSKKEGVDVGEDDGGDGNDEGGLLPEDVATGVTPFGRQHWPRGGEIPLEPGEVSQ